MVLPQLRLLYTLRSLGELLSDCSKSYYLVFVCGCSGLGRCVYIWFQLGLGCNMGWVPYVIVGGGVLIWAFCFCVSCFPQVIICGWCI